MVQIRIAVETGEAIAILTKEEFHAELTIFPPDRYACESEGEYILIHRWYLASGKLIATRWVDEFTGEEQYWRPVGAAQDPRKAPGADCPHG